MGRTHFPFLVTGFSPHVRGCVSDLSRPPLLCSLFLGAAFIISNWISAFRAPPQELAPQEKILQRTLSAEKPGGSLTAGLLGAIAGSCRPSGHLGKLLPTSEGHGDGTGETIRNNVLNLEDNIHNTPGASLMDSSAPGLKEP